MFGIDFIVSAIIFCVCGSCNCKASGTFLYSRNTFRNCGESCLSGYGYKKAFKIEGVVELHTLEKFSQEDVSSLIFHKACSILMDMISLTRESTHILPNPENLSDFGSEHISSTLFN